MQGKQKEFLEQVDQMEIKLTLEEVSNLTGSFINSQDLSISKVDEICEMVPIDMDNYKFGDVYVLTKQEFRLLCEKFKLEMLEENSSGCLTVSLLNEKKLSYPIHTNRELDLMIKGLKPMAVFDYDASEYDEDNFSNQKFSDYYVSHGIKKIVTEFEDGHHRYYFVMPGEEWRVPAYDLLMEAIMKMDYSPHLIWMEGRLLGYSEAENEEYLSGRVNFKNLTRAMKL